MSKEKSKSCFTLPGDKLAVIEECVPGSGTYVESGNIYSEYIGQFILDPIKKIILVNERKTPLLPREGSVVIGIVKDTQDKLSVISIFNIDGKNVSNVFNGILYVSNSSNKYEKNMGEVCKTGDIIKAKVINIKNRAPELATFEKDLGVLIAYCSKCGGLLIKKPNQLVCKICGNKENRKLSIDYGKKP